MKKRIIVFILGLVATASIGTGVYFLANQKEADYSETITYEEATTIIEKLKYGIQEEGFEFWDLQKIDDELYLASYSENPVKDVYKTDHSWILLEEKIVYEVKKGKLVKGEDLDNKIASKFSHNIKTSKETSKKEDIDFEKKESESNRVPKGETSVFTKGEKGEREIIQSFTYVDGKEKTAKKEDKVIKEPVEEHILIGTYVAPTSPPPPPPQPDVKLAGDVVGKRRLTWYNVKYNRDGSLAPWANKMFGKHTFTATGCVPTSLAIALSGYDVHVTPASIGDYLYGQKLFNTASYIGTGGKGVVSAVQNYGLGINGLASEQAVHTALANGNVVVAAIQSGKFGFGSGTHMVVLNGYRDGLTYVTDPSYAYKSSNESISSLWANQSYDVVDRELGYVFYEIVGGGIVVEPEPEPEPEEKFITLEEVKGLSRQEADDYFSQFGITARYSETIVETDNSSLDKTTVIQTSTKGVKHNVNNKSIDLSIIIYKYVAPIEEVEPEE